MQSLKNYTSLIGVILLPTIIKKYISIGVLLLAFAGCAAPLLIPTRQDLALAPANGNGANLDSIREGYILYVNKCGGCHYLYRPTKFTEEKWRKELPEMAGKAKLSQQQQELVLKYLLTMREAGLAEKGK